MGIGWHHCVFLKEDGSLLGMGYNHYGELGIGITGNESTPVQILDSGIAVDGGDGTGVCLAKSARFALFINGSEKVSMETSKALSDPKISDLRRFFRGAIDDLALTDAIWRKIKCMPCIWLVRRRS